MVLLSVFACLFLSGMTTASKVKGYFQCTKQPEGMEHLCLKWIEWNGSMYRFMNTTQNLEKSEMICQEQPYYDTHLVYIEDKYENDFITNMILQCGSISTAWIGLSDKDEEGVWKWGKSKAEYLNWSMNEIRYEPDGGEGENYIIINHFGMGKWYDVSPENRNYHAVCEKEMSGLRGMKRLLSV